MERKLRKINRLSGGYKRTRIVTKTVTKMSLLKKMTRKMSRKKLKNL